MGEPASRTAQPRMVRSQSMDGLARLPRRGFLSTLLAATAFGRLAQAAGGARIVKIVGGRHKLLLLSDGRLWGWGRVDEGQLGPDVAVSGPNTRVPPLAIPLPRPVTDIAAADDVSLALLDDGSVWSWGTGRASGRGVAKAEPGAIAGLESVVQIEGGGSNGLALTKEGSVFAWGGRGSGVVGDGLNPKRYLESGPDAPSPVRVPDVSEVTRLSTMGGFALALRRDGRVLSWGSNRGGQLGRGEPQELVIDAAGEVEGLTRRVATVVAGLQVAYAVHTDGTVSAWGNNQMAQLANGQRGGQTEAGGLRAHPEPIAGLRDVATLSVGASFTCARQQDGTVLGWGNSQLGQLGRRSNDGYVKTPVQMGTAAAAFAAGFNAFLLTGDGRLLACGDNSNGWPFARATFQLAPIEQPWT